MKKVVCANYNQTIEANDVNKGQIVVWYWKDSILSISKLSNVDGRYHWLSLQDSWSYSNTNGFVGYESVCDAILAASDLATMRNYKKSDILVFDSYKEFGEWLSEAA